jgi:hypothetical protein
MDDIKDYDYILNQTLYIIENYSGTHKINIDKAKKWINSQPTIESKIAAKIIIDKTIYITYKDVYNLIEKLVKTEYKKISKTKKNIYMYIGKKNDSNYFISVLALYFIKKYGYRVPTKYFEEIPLEYLNDSDNILLYFDDMAYSGGQISENIQRIYKTVILDKIVNFMEDKYNFKIQLNPNNHNNFHYITEKLNVFFINKTDNDINKIKKDLYKHINLVNYPSIIYLLLGINRIAYERIINLDLSAFILKYLSKIFDNIKNIKLFKLKYKIKFGDMYPVIDDLCSEEELFYISYFFSFGRTPLVSLYFDHKIANQSSTFLRALNFGPVVPKNFDISHYWKPFKYIISDEGFEIAKHNVLKISENYNRFITLCNKYYNKVKFYQMSRK